MYPEFVAIYIMLGVIIVVLAVVIFLLIKLMKNGVSTGTSSNTYIPPVQPVQPMNDYYQQPQYQAPQYQMQYHQQPASNIVYCKQCSGQFDASQAYCPHCGARR